LVDDDDQQLIEVIEDATEGDAGSGTDAPVASDMPLTVNRLVEAYVTLYQGPKRGVFLRGLARSARYKEMIAESLAAEKLPADLFYLAMVESAFNPTARSKAGAGGLWQFMPGTGKIYDLTVTWWLDERFEVEKATKAAARHLKDLYEEFGDWYLAMAAYNAGAGRVGRAIKKSGTRDFWRLPLPAETRNYVPAFIAAVIVGKDPERYGLIPDEEPCLPIETVLVPGGTDLGVIASIGEIGRPSLLEMNPHLKRGCVPPGIDEYPVRVPLGMAGRIVEGLAALPEEQRLSWDRYRIVKGDTFWSVARKTGVPVEVIQEVNGLKKSSPLKAGAELMIPRTRAVTSASTEVKGAPDGRSIVHRVKSGETLWGISRHYGVSVEDLQKVNRLRGTALATGQKLMIARSSDVADRGAAQSDYLVRAGDTLSAIASRLGVSVTTLMQVNGLGPASVIRPGERLVIPSRSRG
jgi:membrane-bound lytic murein transglycosylase D